MTFSKDQSQPGHELAMRLRAAYLFFRRRSSAELTGLGMSSDQFVLLTVLARKGPTTQQGLVRECNSDTTTLGAMLVLLEKNGLIKRETHASDARARVVSLTRTGQRLQKKLWDQSTALRDKLADLFAPGEMPVLLDFLGRITEAMRPPSRTSQRQNHTPTEQVFPKSKNKKL